MKLALQNLEVSTSPCIIDDIGDFQQMPWLTTRYAKDISPGDGVLRKEI
ncbi:hypothetical protein IQ277_19415 [Nostocales cyanobacterium LEGE 12452]|nr:hypothetical protein [Nostocales cyanobacterium LEGE 12452]